MIACLVLVGCSTLGPNIIHSGRPVYNEAIVATNNEQLLTMIVRMRYLEPAGMLAVASVTANVRVRANVAAEFGVGPNDYFAGNLVPLSAGVLYEDNPTISYRPVQGQEFLRQGLAPVPLDLTILLLNALGDSPDVYTFLLREINGLPNPASIRAQPSSDEDRFLELTRLMASLHQTGSLLWTQRAGEGPSFALIIRHGGRDNSSQIARLRELLGLAPPDAPIAIETLPVVHGLGTGENVSLAVMTRAPFELLQIAAASMDVPEAHLESGLAPRVPALGAVGEQISINRSASKPSGALVTVEHYGHWFAIDSADSRSKATFRLLEAIITARMADATDNAAGVPVLTVPVSR